MLPKRFSHKFPHTARALRHMLGVDASEGERKSKITQIITEELSSLAEDAASLNEIILNIRKTLKESPTELLDFGNKAYHNLGISDEVRNFIGAVWSNAMAQWSESNQQEFLIQILKKESFYFFTALDFAPKIFESIPIEPEFMASWIVQVHKKVGNDLNQRGLWNCIRCYSTHQPAQALSIIERHRVETSDQIGGTLARMLSWVRSSGGGPEVEYELKRIETELCMPGSSYMRNLYFESLAKTAESGELTESRAIALREKFVSNSNESLGTWAFLLAQSAKADFSAWRWVYRELSALTVRQSDSTARSWIFTASLAGWKSASSETSVTKEQWADLFFSLEPINALETGFWRQIEYEVADVLETNPGSAMAFLFQLAVTSGAEWRRCLESERDHFSWLHSRLRETKCARALVTRLCLASERSARHVGVLMFEKCLLVSLLPKAINSANAMQIEAIILQLSLLVAENRTKARIHSCIARRVDEIVGEVSELFYREISTESLNTHAYRKELRRRADGHVGLLTRLTDAKTQLDATISALESPALKLHVPGRHRAEALSLRRMSRMIQERASENSLLSHFPVVQLLYGKTWRMIEAGGTLTGPTELTKSGVSMELPRLEFMIPEEMLIRRLTASARINELSKSNEETV